MATPKRIWYEEAIYHITNRGNRKEKIFREEIDFKVYMIIIKNTLDYYSEYNYQLISYCLMSNHVHLLIKTGTRDTGLFMRRINSMYAKYFNDKYDFVGHLFQSRYFSNIITNDIELLEVSRYIHLNPVKAKIVTKAESYKWSSYSEILKKGSCELCNIGLILDTLNLYTGKKDNNEALRYKIYVEEKSASEVNP